MSLFIMGLIIFCCGIIYRLIVIYTRKQDSEKQNKTEIYSETETKTSGIE
jgi:hypothetical protein